MVTEFTQDIIFSALAAIGFSAISNAPRRCYVYLALIAACGHSARFLLMHHDFLGIHIVGATFLAALLIGLLSVMFARILYVPPETFVFPSLLPMVPGLYAYKAFAGLLLCIFQSNETTFEHNFYIFCSNGLLTFFILLGMAIGAMVPIMAFHKISFAATRPRRKH